MPMKSIAALGLLIALCSCSDDDGSTAGSAGGSGSGAVGGSAGSAGSGGAGGSGGGSGNGGSAGSAGGGGGCAADVCPAPLGALSWDCKKRFAYGINYAWHHFAGDFGGISTWNQSGVAGSFADHDASFAKLAASGASVIRWWVFPEFRGESVTFDGNESPTGLGPTVMADLDAALELADKHDVYLMLTLFSFDNFRPTRTEAGIQIVGLSPIAKDAAKRKALIDSVVRPFAVHVESSAHKKRVLAWDVINEPEWAMTGPSPYGDEDYSPDAELQALTHAEMETFVSDVIAGLDGESAALTSVGGASFKWKRAWSQTDVDFHQFHTYGWMQPWWPYDMSPADHGLTDKPVVMGEFPLAEIEPGVSYLELVQSFWDDGYAGALGWHYAEATEAELAAVQQFAADQACEKSF